MLVSSGDLSKLDEIGVILEVEERTWRFHEVLNVVDSSEVLPSPSYLITPRGNHGSRASGAINLLFEKVGKPSIAKKGDCL